MVNLCHLFCRIISIENRLAKIPQPLQQQPTKENTHKLMMNVICIAFFRRDFLSGNKTVINRSQSGKHRDQSWETFFIIKGSLLQNVKHFDSLWFHLDEDGIFLNPIRSILAVCFANTLYYHSDSVNS